jgi:hypothetical protein
MEFQIFATKFNHESFNILKKTSNIKSYKYQLYKNAF